MIQGFGATAFNQIPNLNALLSSMCSRLRMIVVEKQSCRKPKLCVVMKQRHAPAECPVTDSILSSILSTFLTLTQVLISRYAARVLHGI